MDCSPGKRASAISSSSIRCAPPASRPTGITAATIADHDPPHKGDWNAFRRGPLQSLCVDCHKGKWADDKRGYRCDIGDDGLPIDPNHPFNRVTHQRPLRAAGMNKFLMTTALLVAFGAAPANAATEITVDNIGSVFNESLALPAQATPGSGIGFQQFFEFNLPARETVTISMSDSAIGDGRITSGLLSLNDWTSNAGVSPFQPLGALIESSVVNNVLGGQEATVSPDVLSAGNYFAELSGVSGSSAIHIAVDGTITALSTPEASTWAMLAIGFGLLGLIGARRKVGRLAV